MVTVGKLYFSRLSGGFLGHINTVHNTIADLFPMALLQITCCMRRLHLVPSTLVSSQIADSIGQLHQAGRGERSSRWGDSPVTPQLIPPRKAPGDPTCRVPGHGDLPEAARFMQQRAGIVRSWRLYLLLPAPICPVRMRGHGRWQAGQVAKCCFQ